MRSPGDWEILVGHIFMWCDEDPMKVLWGSLGTHGWDRDWEKMDRLEREPGYQPVWPEKLPERLCQEDLIRGIWQSKEVASAFREAMKSWAKTEGGYAHLRRILERAWLVLTHPSLPPTHFNISASLFSHLHVGTALATR